LPTWATLGFVVLALLALDVISGALGYQWSARR
jgi:hypothetical protein